MNSLKELLAHKLLSSRMSPIKEPESPTPHERTLHNKTHMLSEDSEIVCVDPSIEERKKSVRKSKSKLEKFKAMVNQSDSKHLSSVLSVQICENSESGTEFSLDHSYEVSDDLSFFPPLSDPKTQSYREK